MLDKPSKLTTNDVAESYRRHPVTVRIALQDGSLHGRQMKPGGRWLIEESCAEAWSSGAKCEHQSATLNLKRSA